MEVKHFKVQNLPVNCQPNSVYYVLDNITVLGEPKIKVFITDLYGIPIPILDLSGTNGITNITSTDSSITITGSGTSKNIQVSSTLQTLINSALQSGDAISSLLNDAGYITLADVPTFNPSNYDLEDFTNNGADVFIRESDLGAVATSNDYNDLDNKPVIPLPLTNHSELNLDDGTNPHGTTQADVGLPNVNNTSDANKPISNATQAALNNLQSRLNLTKKHIINDTVGASITGVATETLVKAYEIPINTLTISGFIDFWLYTIRSAGASLIHRSYIKINSTNNFGTSTLIGEGSTGGNFAPYLTNFFKFVLKNNLIKSAVGANSNVDIASATQINASCNNTVGSIWIFVSITPGNTNQIISIDGFEVLN